MSNNINKVKTDITEAYGDILSSMGIDPVISETYFTLFFSDEPMGLDELSTETGYSKSSICNFMKVLEKGFDIEKFKKPGSKKVYYRCQHDLMEYLQRILMFKIISTRKMIDVIKGSESELAGNSNPDNDKCLKKIKKMRHEYEEFDKIMSHVLEIQKSKINKK